MGNIENLISEIVKFRDERDWKQFHNSKDLALALSIEAAELNEIYLWKTAEEGDAKKVKEELADILVYALLISHKYKFDVQEIVLEKLKKNALKYPIEKAKGNATKYDQL